MVAEAQAVRERVLKDLATRRKKARQQIEQLNAGRERLLQAYDVVRHTVDEATTELSASVGDARLAAAAAARRIDAEPEPTVEELDEELATARLVDLPITVTPSFVRLPADRPADEEEAVSGGLEPEPVALKPEAAVEPQAEVLIEVETVVVDAVVELEEEPDPTMPEAGAFDPIPSSVPTRLAPEPEPVGEPEPQPASVVAEVEPEPAPEPEPVGEPEPQPASVVAEVEPEPVLADVAPEPPPEPEPLAEVEAEPVVAAESEPESVPEPEVPPARAAAVFAQLHAETTPESEAPEPTDAAPEPDAEPVLTLEAKAFADRAAETAPIVRDLARRLKRELADEQNDVLDRLRRVKPKGVEDLFADADEHTARWSRAAVTALYEAAAAGAHWSGGGASPTARPGRRAGPGPRAARCGSGSSGASWPRTATSTTWPTGSGPSTASGRTSASPRPCPTPWSRPTARACSTRPRRARRSSWVDRPGAGALPGLRRQRPGRRHRQGRGVPHGQPLRTGPPGLPLPGARRHGLTDRLRAALGAVPR